MRALLERMGPDPEPPPLSFGWARVPKKSSIADVSPGADCAIRLADGRELIGRFVDERRRTITFRPWGAPVLVVPKNEITGATVLGSHRWVERRAVSERQARERMERIRGLPSAGAIVPSALR